MARRRLAEHSVLRSATLEPRLFRAVTHLDISEAEIKEAIKRIPQGLARVSR
jgi:hypothetical protein